jgi:hypothetical protein
MSWILVEEGMLEIIYNYCHFIGADSMEFNPLDITSIPLNVTALPNILRYAEP